MAFTPCTAAIAANIASSCDTPRIKGYEQLGIIINKADLDLTACTVDAANSRIVTNIVMATGKNPYALYNNKNNPLPFNGTKTEYQSDSDDYLKTAQFYYEGIGGGKSKSVVEPLKGGEYLLIIPRKDHSGDGSFQVFGFQVGMKANTEVQDEETGYWLITMTANEPSAEVSFFKTDYATTKTAYDALVALTA